MSLIDKPLSIIFSSQVKFKTECISNSYEISNINKGICEEGVYTLSKRDKELLERKIKESNYIVTLVELGLSQELKTNMKHPLVMHKILVPNNVSEYGRIINYRIAKNYMDLLQKLSK